MESGIIKQDRGDLRGAFDDYLRAVSIFPALAEAHFRLGDMLMSQRRYREALGEFDTALKHDRSLTEAHCAMGEIHHQLGDDMKAEAEFRESIRTKPEYIQAWVNLGNLLMNSGRFAEAKTVFTEAQQHAVDPADRQQLQRYLL